MNEFLWTDEQWQEWGKRTVTVDLDFFDRLFTAVGLLVQGVRLNRTERDSWTTALRSCQEIIAQERASINALAEALGQEQEASDD